MLDTFAYLVQIWSWLAKYLMTYRDWQTNGRADGCTDRRTDATDHKNPTASEAEFVSLKKNILFCSQISPQAAKSIERATGWL